MATATTPSTGSGLPSINLGTIPSTVASTPGSALTVIPSKFSLTAGWYVFFGTLTGVLVSNTQVGPVALAILGSALLYQVSQLLKGK